MCTSVVVVLELTLFYSKLAARMRNAPFSLFALLRGLLEDSRLVKHQGQWYLYQSL